MAGFFPHTGGSPQGYTALPVSSFANILSDIVADIGSGVNGWTLYDDQRSGTPLVVPFACTGYVTGLVSANGTTMTNGSSAISQGNNNAMRFARCIAPGVTQISSDQSNWYTINAANANGYQATLDRNYTGTSISPGRAYTKTGGYVVLQCTSQQKTFYVLLARGASYGDLLFVQVYETWNASTHVGANPSTMEIMRGFSSQQSSTSKIQYILWALPDALGLWTSGDPSFSGVADFLYVGNLTPYRVGDTSCLLFACSNMDYSGLNAYYATSITDANNTVGCAEIWKSISSTMWSNSVIQHPCMTTLSPRGYSYLDDFTRTSLDDAARFQYCDVDAYQSAKPSSTGMVGNEGKRGDVKYLKYPIMNPSGLHLASFGPSDDGNTYVMIRCDFPGSVGNNTPPSGDVYNGYSASSFAFASRTNSSTSIGEVILYTYFPVCTFRFFLMPVNL
jgi:hypothetical protein